MYTTYDCLTMCSRKLSRVMRVKMSKKKILVIDDKAGFCKRVKINMEAIGDFGVAIANNGRKGIALAKKLRPDLILLHTEMSRMDGFEVIETLKADDNTMQIPVVMFATNLDDESKIKALGTYAEAYISKSIEALELKNIIEDVLKRQCQKG